MNNREREIFGSYLRKLRRQADLTQKDAAVLAQISVPYITLLERGQRNPPSSEILARLAAAYGVSADDLLKVARQGIQQDDAGLSWERLDWAYRCACSDPETVFGDLMLNQQYTSAEKAVIVDRYQKRLGRQLLTLQENQGLERLLQESTDNDRVA